MTTSFRLPAILLSLRVLGVLGALCSPLHAQLQAQEIIPIDAENIGRMGIIFAPVRAVDSSAGARFPATVIHSPAAVATGVALYPGILSEWLHSVGDSVESGAVLASIRSPEILPVQNEWIAAVTMLESARFEQGKDDTLFAQGVISRQRLDQTNRALQQATFAEQAARASLQQAGFNAARLDALRQNATGLGLFYITAPAAGVLAQRGVQTGGVVEADHPIATVNGSDNRWISAHVPARAALGLVTGQLLSVVGSAEQLTLRQIDSVVDSRDQTVELLAEFAGSTGSSVGQIISVILPPNGDGVLIPDRAVVHSGNETTIYVRAAGGVEARVLPLTSIGADYLARSGMTAGEQVVIQGTAVIKGIQLGLGGDE